jgi:hypothetical protein
MADLFVQWGRRAGGDAVHIAILHLGLSTSEHEAAGAVRPNEVNVVFLEDLARALRKHRQSKQKEKERKMNEWVGVLRSGEPLSASLLRAGTHARGR